MIHSQSDEEPVILEFFKDQPEGIVLDIGAYHYATFSNSRALINKGWHAVLVEPSPRCFSTIMRFYNNDPKVTLINACVSDRYGMIEFYDSEGAVASTDKEHFARWSTLQKDFIKIWVPTIPAFMLTHVVTKCDLISIDCEAHDFTILKNLPLHTMQPKLVCIEYGNQGSEIQDHMGDLGYILHHQNNENLIFRKA